MLPAPKGKNVEAQFISYLKNTAQIPKGKRSVSKQNQHPHQYENQPHQKELRKEQKRPQSRIVQGDFSQISTSYILQGNVLKKKEIYDEAKTAQSQIHQNDKENQIMKNRKEILKLQYLQKMGVLKPEEEVILKKYRKLNPQKAVKKAEDQSSQNYSKKKQVKQPVQQFYAPPSTMNYFSPKNMPNMNKNMGTYFSPKHDNMHGYGHYHHSQIN